MDNAFRDAHSLAMAAGSSSFVTGSSSSSGDQDINKKYDPDDTYDYDVGGNSNLIINYLPPHADEGLLTRIFNDSGPLESIKIVRDRTSKKCLGYGFVKFLHEKDAIRAIAEKNGLQLGRKRIKVSPARPPSDDIKNCKLYVTNLPRHFGEAEVVALFSRFGEIIECRVLKESSPSSRGNRTGGGEDYNRGGAVRSNANDLATGRPGGTKGVAFVQFNIKQQAEAALSLEGYQLPDAVRPLSVKIAEDRRHDPRAGRARGTSGVIRGRSTDDFYVGASSVGGGGGGDEMMGAQTSVRVVAPPNMLQQQQIFPSGAYIGGPSGVVSYSPYAISMPPIGAVPGISSYWQLQHLSPSQQAAEASHQYPPQHYDLQLQQQYSTHGRASIYSDRNQRTDRLLHNNIQTSNRYLHGDSNPPPDGFDTMSNRNMKPP